MNDIVASNPYFVDPGAGNAGAWDDATRASREGLLGALKNKGWDQKSPIEALAEAIKSYNEVEKHLGIPKDQIVRMPKDAADKEGWAAFNKRIGVPEKAEEYDFSKIKFADGSDLDDDFVTAMRNSAFARGIPANKASELVADVVKFMDGSDEVAAAKAQAAIAAGRDELAKSWGANAEANKFIASQAVLKLQLPEEFLNGMEKQVGYAQTMQTMLKLGQMMGEDKFVSNQQGPTKGVLTREQASARLSDLKRDAEWVAKVNAGDFNANEEFDALTRVMAMGV